MLYKYNVFNVLPQCFMAMAMCKGSSIKDVRKSGGAGVKKNRRHADIEGKGQPGGGGVKQTWTPTLGSKFKYLIPRSQ